MKRNKKPTAPRPKSNNNLQDYELSFSVKLTIKTHSAKDAEDITRYIAGQLEKEASVPNSENISVDVLSIEYKAKTS